MPHDNPNMTLPRRAFLCQAGTVSSMALLCGASAVAQTPDAPTPTPAPALPPEVGQELTQAQWSGSARMRFFGLSIYDVSLWVAPGFSARRFERQPLVLELRYLRELSGKDIAQRSLDEMRRQGDISPAQGQTWLAAMQRAFPDVKAGERITGLHQPETGARFWHQGRATAQVPDAVFSRLFFGIWLADATSEPKLRSALLARAAP
jgi:hypothetical protein